jgi:hypothetical protein
MECLTYCTAIGRTCNDIVFNIEIVPLQVETLNVSVELVLKTFPGCHNKWMLTMNAIAQIKKVDTH